MSRRARKKAKRSDAVTGTLLVILGLILTGALAVGALWLKEAKVKLGKDLCPISGPRAVHVVMFDRSDPVSGQQEQRIRQIMDQLKEDAQLWKRFDIYTFDGDERSALKPVLSICDPGKEANIWIENPEQVRRRYQEFSAVLDKTIKDLLRESTRPNSPIIESLRAAALASFGPLKDGQLPLRVTMISDMVQHSAAVSHFRDDADFERLSRSHAWASLRPKLRGARVDILYINRPTAERQRAPIQSRGHQLFWEQLIAAAGGQFKVDAFQLL